MLASWLMTTAVESEMSMTVATTVGWSVLYARRFIFWNTVNGPGNRFTVSIGPLLESSGGLKDRTASTNGFSYFQQTPFIAFISFSNTFKEISIFSTKVRYPYPLDPPENLSHTMRMYCTKLRSQNKKLLALAP